jgi:hypothetical protein
MNLKINLESFTNQYGVKSDRRCCFENTGTGDDETSVACTQKCSTFFRICLAGDMNDDHKTCVETGVIGENSINSDQFGLGMDSVRFQSVTSQQSYLVVDAFNDKSVDGQFTDKKRELISKWSVSVPMGQLNQVHLLDKSNQYLNQNLKISYKFECASGYSGANCSTGQLR